MSDRSAAADAAFAEASPDACASGPPATGDSAVSSPAQPPALPPVATAPPPLPIARPLGPMPYPPPSVALPIGPLAADIEPLAEEEESLWRDWWVQLPSWTASMVAHLLLVLALALVTTLSVVQDAPTSLLVSTDGEALDDAPPEELSAELTESSEDLKQAELLEPVPLPELPAAAIDAGPLQTIAPYGELKIGAGEADAESLLATVGGNGLELRMDGKLRSALVRAGGGTPQSEEAVMLALKWLADHQEGDGSWSFQHHKHPKCSGRCENPGITPGKTAATGLALLPFLGTGQTQFEGVHKRTIELALKFLVRSMQHEEDVGSLWDPHGTMYGHGLASIALCEAYGMTRDSSLREPAQAALNFIVKAQDHGGGWRYYPQTPGDTSVVGWQVMALKSGEMARLRVPHDAFRKAGYFLDSVQGMNGAVYGYQRPDTQRPPTTAIGLLCRMYLGWNRQTRPLAHGVQILGTLGPSTDKTGMRNNMYYNYYATQVMHHWGGYPWQRWNAVMRDYLVKSQSRRGHEYGSWYFEGDDLGSGAGGRLYCTAMAAMTLEVYYRHMPLYREKSVNAQDAGE